jgi:hypothetical protein
MRYDYLYSGSSGYESSNTGKDQDYGEPPRPDVLGPVNDEVVGILFDIKKEKDRYDNRTFKENVLKIGQIYFDDLFESKRPSEEGEKKVYDNLLMAMELTVTGFYNHDIPKDAVRRLIFPNKYHLLECQSKPKSRHLSGGENEVANFSESLLHYLKMLGVDTVTPIASGGFEPAILISDLLGAPSFLPLRYSSYGRSDTKVLYPPFVSDEKISSMICDKNVIIIDDVVSSGKSSCMVANSLETYEPNKIYFACISYKEPGPVYGVFKEISSSKNHYLFEKVTAHQTPL